MLMFRIVIEVVKFDFFQTKHAENQQQSWGWPEARPSTATPDHSWLVTSVRTSSKSAGEQLFALQRALPPSPQTLKIPLLSTIFLNSQTRIFEGTGLVLAKESLWQKMVCLRAKTFFSEMKESWLMASSPWQMRSWALHCTIGCDISITIMACSFIL